MSKQTDNKLTHSTPLHPEPYNLSSETASDTRKINNNTPESEGGEMPIANEAEERFKEWLEHKGYPYLYIEQSPDLFASFFRDTGVKRPDFLILVRGLGLIAVDVKSRELQREHETFIIDEEKDISKLIAFERIFRIPVWLAISNKAYAYRTWYWITLSEIVEKVDKRRSSLDGNEFRAIPIKMCRTIGWDNHIGEIFQI